MKKRWLRILKWITGICLLLTISFAAVLYLNRDRIITAVLEESNKYLVVPVDVGHIDVSFRKFPLASLRFEEVYCQGKSELPTDTLLYARDMFFEFHLWKVLLGDLSIAGISVENGTLHLNFPENSDPNYVIWKADTVSSSSGLFKLDDVNLLNIKFRLKHHSSRLNAFSHLEHVHFSGDFAGSNFHIISDGSFYMDSLKLDDVTYVKDMAFSTGLEIADQKGLTRIYEGKLHSGDMNFNYEVDVLDDLVDVRVQGQNLDVAGLIVLINEQKWTELPEKLSATGIADFDFTGEFPTTGVYSHKTNFRIHEGGVKGLHNSHIREIGMNGSYEFKDEWDRLTIKNFNGKGRTGNLAGSLIISDLQNPAVVLDLKSDLALNEWLIFLPLDTIEHPTGRALVDLHLENRFNSLKDIKPEELKRTRAEGSFQLQKIGFQFKNSDKNISNLNGDLIFANDNLKINSFYFETGRSDIYLTGYFGNVLNYIFFKNQKLLVETRLKSQELFLEDFLLSGSGSSEEYNLEFVNSLELDLNLQIDRFYFANFFAEEFKGDLQLHKGIIQGSSISLIADHGNFNGHFAIDTRPREEYLFSATLSGRHADLHDVFESLDNFGQDVILAENIFGTADLDIQISTTLTNNLYINPASVDLSAHLMIVNGNLKNYEPMLALSDYANLTELRDVKFDRLENTISIKNSVVTIPEMTIHSNVMDMDISGRHHFDNNIDYSLRLKLADVIFKKRSSAKRNSEFDQHLTEVEKQDDPNIYVKMTGSVYNPVITLDKDNIKKSIQDDLRDQGQEIKNIFTGKNKNDKTKTKSGIEYDLFGEDDKKPPH